MAVGAKMNFEHWSTERVQAYQTDAVAEQLARVFAHNAFYREKFAQAGVSPADFLTLEDLADFPFTTKDELRGQPWLLLSVPKEQVVQAHTSTGTTGGAWSYILYSWEDLAVRDVAVFPHALMPVKAGDVVANALPYEMSSSGQSFQRSIQGATGALVVPVGKGGFYSEPEKTVKIMADFGATVLITTPPYALVLAEAAGKLGLRPGADIPLRFLWLTGEGCSPAYRRRLEEAWGVPGLVFYGSMECGAIAVECGQQKGSHVCAGHVYLEIVDPNSGVPTKPGEIGEVVCTVLQRTASPLLRFRTQDLAALDPTPCPCGIALPRLYLRGRIIDQMHSAGADVMADVSPYLIEEVLYSQPEMGNNYQVWMGSDRLLIDAELRGGDAEAARERIVSALRHKGLTVELDWVAHVPRTGGKTRRIRPLGERQP